MAKRDKGALRIATHDELVAALPEIFRRFNANPELARLLLVNPLFVLEDLNVQLSDELQDHIRRTIGFPKGRVEEIAKERKAVRQRLAELAGDGPTPAIPKTPKERADLVFDRLGVAPIGARPDALTVEDLAPYRAAHPIVAMLHNLGVLERGAITFHTRGTYEAHKEGRPHHPWLVRLRFNVPK